MSTGIKFDQRIYQENLILKKVLQVTIFHPQDPNDPLSKLSSGSDFFYLQSANRELQKYPTIKSLLERKTLFDTIFSEILSQPKRYGFIYLLECFSSNIAEKDKAVNKDFQELFTFMLEMTINYTSILVLNPDMFPEILPESNQHEGVQLSALRLVHMFEQSGYSPGFMQEINKQLKAMDEDSFNQVYEFIFGSIRQKFQKELTVFDSHSTTFLDILSSILNESDEMKDIFINLKYQGVVWIPGPGGINLTKGIGSCTGDMLEHQSVMGPFLSVSFLPVSLNLTADQKFLKTIEKAEAEMKQAKTQQQYNKIASNLQELHKKYVQSLNNLFKTLLKGKTVREQVMRFLAACVVSNTPRAKLGHNLMQNSMQNKLNQISSDSFCLNAQYLLYELCVPFLDLQKDLWKKVDPTYIPSGMRMDLTDETPICAKKEFKKSLTFPKEYGTISEFYFMELEMIHFGLLHSVRKYLDIRKLIERYQSEKKAHNSDQNIQTKIDHELEKLKPFRIGYEVVLTDQNLAKSVERFYTVHMRLMREWGGYDEKRVKLNDSPGIYCHLPENFMQDMFDVIQEIIKVNVLGHKAFQFDTVINITEYCLALLRTETEVITNPYIKAKALELIAIFHQSDQKKELLPYFSKSEVITNTLMETVIKFYVDIEFAGSSMFYTKFQYRHDCSQIFQRFWTQETFRQKTRELIGHPIFEKFLNSLINDMTFCLEEGLVKLTKIKEYEDKVVREGTKSQTKEEHDNHKQNKSVCRANFQLAGESIWNVKQLSSWCKQIFDNEAFAERIATTLNFVLNSLVGPDSHNSSIKNPEKVALKPNQLISDLAVIYGNLSEIEHFCKAVVRDDRSFSTDNFNTALRRLKIAKVGENLSEFEKFVHQIPKYTQQEAELEEILGNDAPEEFLCLLTYRLMKDPVKLPTSGNVCDKSTMQRILLNDEHDPFNRAPLKFEQLIEEHGLRQRIETWIRQKLAGEETDEDKRQQAMKDTPMESPSKDQEEQKEGDMEDDYTSAFFDEDQLKQLGHKDSDVDMFSQQTISNFMAQNNNKFDKPFE